MMAMTDVEKTTGHQLLVMGVWFCFVLLNAFYALTMFFTSVSWVTFEEIGDVMKAYPTF
jgi:hypothetical protein